VTLGRLTRQRYALEARLDLLRTIGVGHSWRRLREDRRHRRALERRRARVTDEMWREAAVELDAEIRELAPSLLEFRLGEAWTRVRGQTTPFSDAVSAQVASDKPLAYRLLTEAGIPVPAHEVVDVAAHADPEALLARIGAPCIVKPAVGAGGDGVTGEIRSAQQLRRALHRVWKMHDHALVEHQVEGDSYRLLLLDGEVLDVLRRHRPHVVGDGRSTVEELIFGEYARRIEDEGPAGIKPFIVDLDCLFTLEHAGLSIESVLPAGASAVVKTATNYNAPEDTETVRGKVPATLVEPARLAAAALGIRLAGVDIVARDLGGPLASSGGVVLEVNDVPGLTHHYNVADAAGATCVAVPILRALLGA
jgi:D-alanine-D-alanine ligase-like ATP-grasp enzyme